MEIMRGKHAAAMDARILAERLAGYNTIHLDMGTGDGRFVQHIAQTQPHHFVIGLDACRDKLHEVSRRAPPNALFVIASAQTLPPELSGLASQVTINFPWGSLLEGLLTGDPALLAGLRAIARPDAGLDIRVNGGALAEVGHTLETGAAQIREVLLTGGFRMRTPVVMSARELRSCPTTWARRLAFGCDPQAIFLRGHRG